MEADHFRPTARRKNSYREGQMQETSARRERTATRFEAIFAVYDSWERDIHLIA
jgi:hypothetical protein